MVASSENGFDGCHPEHALPCYETNLACESEITKLNNGNQIVIRSNNIPGLSKFLLFFLFIRITSDHNSWALTGRTSTIEENSNIFRMALVPTLAAETTTAPQGIKYSPNTLHGYRQ